MSETMFLLRRRFYLTVLKLFALAAVAGMAWLQVPELRYDFSGAEPVAIAGPAELEALRGKGSVFAAVAGKGDFDKAFINKTYGLTYTYFLLKPYGAALVVRSTERVTDDWRALDRFVGRVRSFRRMPFSRRVRRSYREQFGVEIPAGAMFLARDDVPAPSGWQIGALIFVSLLWVVLVWLFFIRRRKEPAPVTSQ